MGRPGARSFGSTLALWTAAYVVAHALGAVTTDPARHVGAIWPAAGVTLAALVSTPRRRWGWTMAALGAAAFLSNSLRQGVGLSAGFLVANVVESLAAAWLVTTVAKRPVTFERLDEVLALGAAATLVNGVTAFLGAGSVHLLAHGSFWSVYRTWAISNMLGLLLVAPLLTAWLRPRLDDEADLRKRPIELVLFALVWCVGAWVVTHDMGLAGPLAPRPYLLVCLVPWASLRFGLRVVSAALVVLYAFVVAAALSGAMHRDFEGASVADTMMQVQVYVVLVASTGLFLSATWSEAHVARAAAARSAEHLRLALDSSRMGAWEWDIPSDTVRWSDEVSRMFGLRPGAAPASREDYLALIHPEDRDAMLEVIQKLLAGESDHFSWEHRVLPVEGTPRWVEGRGRLTRDSRGAPLRMAGTVVDVSEQHNVAERAQQAQKMEVLGQVTGGVAHDFNNVLAAILVQAEVARRRAPAGSEVAGLLDEIILSTRSGTALTRQLLAFSRAQVLRPTAVDLNDVLSDVGQMIARLIGSNIRMHVEPSPVPVVANADAGMLGQVVLNLAVNARDAMPSGGEVTIATSTRTIPSTEVPSAPDRPVPGTYACLRVTDQGSGIAPADMPRLFEPFFTTKGPEKGTGLGLPTVLSIVKLHHGFIEVQSELGKGTTFEILLPFAASTAPAPAPSRTRSTILLVEDDVRLRTTTRMLLASSGYDVLEAASVPEALREWEARDGRVELLFTDVTLAGGGDGRELAAELRRRSPGLGVIVTSGSGAARSPDERFLAKPCPPDEMLATVRDALAR